MGRRFAFLCDTAYAAGSGATVRNAAARNPVVPRAFFMIAALLLVPVGVLAQVADGTGSYAAGEPLTGVVDTLEVVSERPAPLESLPTFATVHDVSARLSRVSTIVDVIEQGAGVHVRRYGGLGSYSTASIRASSPGQVEVYVDGVPVNSSMYGATNLSDLPLDNLERIEVYRGGAPPEFGSPGVGGVVNLVTRSPGRGHASAALSAGSHETYRMDLLRSGSHGLDYTVSFHHLQSEGDFEYLDRHGTPENESDDALVARENNDFRESDVLLRLDTGPWAGWRVEAADEVYWKRSGVPGIENVHIKSVHYRIFRNTARLSVVPPRIARGALSLKATGFHSFRRDRFYNPDDEVGFDRADSDDRNWSYGANALARFDWHAVRQSVSLFGETRRERFIPESLNPAIGVGFTRKRSSVSLSGEDRLFLMGGRLELVAGYRYQEASDNYAGPPPIGGPPEALDELHRADVHGPSFGARLRVHPRVTLKANRTRYARFPSMVELFGASGYVEGNAELSPEEGTTADIGIALSAESSAGGEAFLEAVLFWADRDDLIVFLQNSQRTVKAFNLESARIEGIELTARRTFGTRLHLSASYTYQNARNDGPSPTYHGKLLPYEPVHDLFVRSEWDAGRASVWHEYHARGEAYRDRANLPENRSPASHVHNLGGSVEVVPGALTLSLEVRNLTDETLLDVEGYPLPGRTFYATLLVETSR
ncbi:MAG: TonB-dependent receptor [Candidatus Eisenbacteria bacterium]